MHQCRTTYSKALLLSVMIHVAVVGSAIAFAQYGGTFFSGDIRSITVSLLGDNDLGGSGGMKHANRMHGMSVPFSEAPKQEPWKDHPHEDDVPVESPRGAGGGDESATTAGAGLQSPGPAGEGQGQPGEISLEQWQLVQSALEKAKTYPRLARERGVEGVVLVRINVLPTGEIERVDIIKSSGSDILDTATVRTVLHVFRTTPMPHVNGWVDVPMSYILK